MNFEEKTKNQGTSKPGASHSENGDMAWACCEELVELDDVQLATVVGGVEEGGVVTPFAWWGVTPRWGWGWGWGDPPPQLSGGAHSLKRKPLVSPPAS